MEIQETINIQPPASIYGTFSRYSYKIWYAIAEFVDNSTSSFYKNERSLKFYHQDKLVVDIDYDPNANILRITDNAFGMEIQDFRRAILLDAKPENNDGRNEFGMGLKTAASWFGKVWSVTSTQLGSPNKYTATVDIPHLEKEKTNNVDIYKMKANPSEHGTVIEIRELTKRPDGPRTIGKIKDILRSMYRRDLDSGKVEIRYNHENLTFEKYHILCSGDKEWRKNLDFYFNYDGIHHVTGFVALLGEGKNKDSGSYPLAGFALFRRNRVVVGAPGEYYKPLEIFKQAQNNIAKNMFGELDLDDFPINQAKDGFVWDNGLEEEFIKALKIQVADYAKIAEKKKPSKDDDFDPSNKKEIENNKKDTQKSLNNLDENPREQVETHKEHENETEIEKEFRESFESVPESQEEKVYQESTVEYTVPISFSQEKFKVTWSDAGGAYWYSFDKDKNEIKINMAHPFFKPFSSSEDFRNVLNKFVIAIYLAEKRALSTSQDDGYAYVDDINNEINEILKKLAP